MMASGGWLVFGVRFLTTLAALALVGCLDDSHRGNRDGLLDAADPPADGAVVDAEVPPRPDLSFRFDAEFQRDEGPGPDAEVAPDATPDAILDAGPPSDADLDPDQGVTPDVGPDPDAGPQPDVGPDPDAGPLPEEGSQVAPAAEVIRQGAGGYLLRGDAVLTPDGPLFDAEVLIVGTDIRCVGLSCADEPEAAGVTIIDTHATIAPGLIDAHNHLTYDFLTEWVPDPPRLFDSRYEWRGDDGYHDHVAPESAGGSRGDFICPATKWGELRSIIHGTTTVQGQSPNQACVGRLARNADHRTGLGPDRVRTTISGPCEAALDDDARVGVVAGFVSGDTTRYFVHMAEGVTGTGQAANVLREFECYAGTFRHTISLLRDANGQPYGTSVFIHAITLTEDQLLEAAATRTRFVWSPSSNLILYGQTAPIERMLELGLTVGLGPDWTPSGSDDLLAEMRFALAWAEAEAIEAVTPEVLVRMASTDGADVVGLETQIGRLAPGFRADIAVFGRVARDPYRAVTDSRAEDVRLVMIDGAGYFGDAGLEANAAVNRSCEAMDACGTAKFICAAGTPGDASRAGDTVADLEAQLRAHMATVNRNDLLPLIDCTP